MALTKKIYWTTLIAVVGIGCVLVLWRVRADSDGARDDATRRRTTVTQGKKVTFATDVAPIIFENCTACHRRGAAAPFPLLSFEDVHKRAQQIADVTADRYMPPWLPGDGNPDFEDERRLSADEIELIQQWVDQGAVAGDLSDAPAPPVFTEGWQLGEPDLVVKLPQPYTLPAEGTDVFRYFVIPAPVSKSRYVKAVEWRIENPAVVHHALLFLDSTYSSRRLDAADPQPGFGQLMTLAYAQPPRGHIVGWLPGNQPIMGSEDTSWPLDAQTDLVVQLHMVPSGRSESVQVSLGIHFAESAPKQHPFMLELTREDIDIPAGEKQHVITDKFILPADVNVLAIMPHAHYLGKKLKGFAALPDGTRKTLIQINDWDFNWQDFYRYARPLSLPKGSVLSLAYSYDNSADNVRNPNQPPQRVRFGNRTRDEMAELWIQVLPGSAEGLHALKMAVNRRLLERQPNHAPTYHNLGALYAEEGNFTMAKLHLKRAVSLRPDLDMSHLGLGKLYLQEGSLAEATSHFEQAIKVRPEWPEAYLRLGFALVKQGRLDEAVASYREAIRLGADSANAHYELGVVLTELGRIDEARERLIQAGRLKPRKVMVMNNRAWILATHPDENLRDPTTAVFYAEVVAELTRQQNARFLDTLAAAHAANGEFERAVSTAEKAIAIASDGKDKDLEFVGSIRRRLELYQRSKAYRDPPPAPADR